MALVSPFQPEIFYEEDQNNYFLTRNLGKLDPCLIFAREQNIQRNYYCFMQCLMIVKVAEFSPPEKLATGSKR